jgi:hypothetical protein
MFTVFVLTVRVALLTLVLAAFIAVQLSRAQRMIADDTDNDGLPNQWETSGHGPIKPGEHGCSPKRADMFLVICIRPGMTRAQVEPTLNEVKRFFRALPLANPDGSRGINVITVWGNDLPDSDRKTEYDKLYEKCMPREWRGLAHGVLIEPHTGGGGQTSRSDWSGASNDWVTVVHELGHQLGLEHAPRGSAVHSPLYTSLMNYDYNYSFNGDPKLVHFSTGKFASLRLNETAVSEVLPVSIADLQFLSKSPYEFRLRSAGPTTTHVDWNRNGVFGETSVKADINDGYAVVVRGEHNLGKCAGSPSLVAGTGRDLIVVYPIMTDTSRAVMDDRHRNYEKAGLTPESPGNLVARTWDGSTWSAPRLLLGSVGGDHTAVYAMGHLFVATTLSTREGRPEQAYPALSCFRLSPSIVPHAGPESIGPRGDRVSPVLVATRLPEELWLFVWSPRTKSVKYRRVNLADGRPARIELGPEQELRTLSESPVLVTSQFPVHAVYDSSLERVILVTTERRGTANGRIRVHTLGRQAGGRWASLHSRLARGETGDAATAARPCIVHDPSTHRGAYGGYLIFVKGFVADSDQPANPWVVRTVGDRTEWDGWRSRRVGNEWFSTRSALSATFYQGDIALAMRWYGEDEKGNNDLLVFLQASGIEDGTMIADHDDVSYIRNSGLRRSLGR